MRAGDPVEIGIFTKRVAFLGLRLITPSAVLVLILGVVLVIESAWNFSATWIELALLGFVVTFLTGAPFIGPESERISKLIDSEGADSPECRRRIRRIFLVSRVDLLVIVLIVLDMVTKPGV